MAVPVNDPGGAADARTVRSFPRNDRISPVAVALVLIFWVVQSSFFPGLLSMAVHHGRIPGGLSARSAESGLPDAVEQGLLSIDIEAKSSYLALPKRLAGGAGKVIASAAAQAGAKARRSALAQAIRLLSRYPDQPSLARRVILLRAECGNTDPLGPLPPRKGKRSSITPLAAFRVPAEGASPAEIAEIDAEASTWRALFGSNRPITSASAPELAAKIRSLYNLRWWSNLAMHQLYLRAGDPAAASAALSDARAQAQTSVAASSMIGGLEIVCIGIGAVLLVLLLAGRLLPRSEDGEGESFFEPTPPLIRDEDRRLGAGDLANLFCLYLIVMMSAQIVAPFFLPAIVGPRATAMISESERVSIVIAAEAIATILCGAITVAALFWLAARRGASVAAEIGLNRGRLPLARMILFGLAGWCISVPLVLISTEIGGFVFHNAPEPANPAIPLLMSTPGAVSALILLALVSVFAPFFEETVFRGLFYNAARLRVGSTWGIVVTGLTFGLSHPVGIAEQVPLAVLGGVLAWMAQTRKSLLPGMIAHCVQNSFAYALLYFTMMAIVAR